MKKYVKLDSSAINCQTKHTPTQSSRLNKSDVQQSFVQRVKQKQRLLSPTHSTEQAKHSLPSVKSKPPKRSYKVLQVTRMLRIFLQAPEVREVVAVLVFCLTCQHGKGLADMLTVLVSNTSAISFAALWTWLFVLSVTKNEYTNVWSSSYPALEVMQHPALLYDPSLHRELLNKGRYYNVEHLYISVGLHR